MLKTWAPRGVLALGGSSSFSFCLSRKRRLPKLPNARHPERSVMAISLCLSKERQFQATKPCRAPRSPSGPCGAPCAPQPRSPAELRAHPSHGALQSPGEVLFFDRQREKRIAGTPRLPFPCQAEGKAFRKRTACSHDCRFLDRKGGKGIASTRHVPMIAFSSTGRGETESQAQAMFPRPPFPRQW